MSCQICPFSFITCDIWYSNLIQNYSTKINVSFEFASILKNTIHTSLLMSLAVYDNRQSRTRLNFMSENAEEKKIQIYVFRKG